MRDKSKKFNVYLNASFVGTMIWNKCGLYSTPQLARLRNYLFYKRVAKLMKRIKNEQFSK